jgi:hypothetical protein
MAIISAVSNIVAGNKAAKAQTSAARQAADVSERTAAEDRALQWKMYQQQRGDYEKFYGRGRTDLNTGYANALQTLGPYDDAGPAATSRLAELAGVYGSGAQLSALQSDPGYQFRMQQGIQATDRSAAARGMLMSGANQKALTEFGQGLASSELNNAYNRVAGVADAGRNAATNIANTYTGRGTALANLATGQATNLSALGTNTTNALQGISNTNLQNQTTALNNIGQARASGYLNTGRSIQQGMDTTRNTLMNLAFPNSTYKPY